MRLGLGARECIMSIRVLTWIEVQVGVCVCFQRTPDVAQHVRDCRFISMAWCVYIDLYIHPLLLSVLKVRVKKDGHVMCPVAG